MGLVERWQRGELQVLSEAECMQLLAGSNFGRFAYNDNDGPVVIPVNYTVTSGTLLIATSPYSELAQHAHSVSAAAFQVDTIDVEQHTGWSVLVRGRTEAADYDDLPSAHTARPAPWAAGTRTLYIRIVPRSVTGRRLLPA